MKSTIYTLSQYKEIDSAYWGLGFRRDKLYVGLCTHNPAYSAVFCFFDVNTKKIEKIFSLSDIIPSRSGFSPQGKIHTPIFAATDGNMYFATHFAYPFGIPQTIRYPGGHIIRYDPGLNDAEDLGILLKNEGLITLILDSQKMIAYCLTAPSGHFVFFDIESKKTHDFGPVMNSGSICRSLALDNEHNVYGSYENNQIFRFNFKLQKIGHVTTELPDDSNNIKEWRGKMRGGVNYTGRKLWRSAVLDSKTNEIYGIHASTMNLFSYLPEQNECHDIVYMGDKTTKSKHDEIYPSLSLVIHERKLFYALAKGSFDYSRSEGIYGPASLLSFDLEDKFLVNHGAMKSKRTIYGIGGSHITDRGTLYLLGAVERKPGEDYNPFNRFNRKPFHVGLIEIDTTSLKYEKN